MPRESLKCHKHFRSQYTCAKAQRKLQRLRQAEVSRLCKVEVGCRADEELQLGLHLGLRMQGQEQDHIGQTVKQTQMPMEHPEAP